tara:strand:- start:320 stop:661 length:342 start_codon:yes stop_codon:yes gene_type:complete
MSMKNKAIYALYSNAVSIGGDAEIVLDGNDIDITSTIDMDAVEAKAAELLTAQNLTDLRTERNAKLAETDWVITMHKEKGTNIPAAWKTYRDALRDITDSATSLDDVTWPEKP